VAVSDLKVVAGAQAAPTASVSFTTPSQAVDGSTLSALKNVKIYRGETLVKEFSAPAVGAQLSFEEGNLTTMEYTTYRVVSATEAGESVEAADSAWIGEDAPSEPKVSIAVAGGHPVLSWETPTGVGQHGGYFTPEKLAYIVYDPSNNNILGANLTEHTYTDESYTVTDEGAQSLHQYGVFARNTSDDWLIGYPGTAFVLNGAKYALPFKESFAKGTTDQLLLTSTTNSDNDGYDEWGIDDDYNTSSADKDGGSIFIMPATPGLQATIQMGKIDMTAAKNSTLSFYVKRLAYDYDYMETDPQDDYLNVYVAGADYEQHLMATIRPYDLEANATYQKFTFPLTQFEGQDFISLQFQLNAVAAYYAIALDDIEVRNNYTVNLQTTAFNVPAQVDVTSDFEATVSVTNDALTPAAGYTVAIAKDGAVIASQQPADTLAAGETKTYTLQLKAESLWADSVQLVASVNIAADEVAADDTLSAHLVVLRPAVDGVKDLTASVEGSVATFSWTAPTIATAERVTESFESYAHGARKDFGAWSVIDEDGNYGYNLDIELPGYFASRAFTVVNLEEADADDWTTHSGAQLVAALSNWEDENDDWLVSPKLSGAAQKISFWARGLKAGTDEIYVYYSTTGSEAADFKAERKLDDNRITLTADWVQYSFELPAGALYFAIRYYVDNGEGALVDDVEFEQAAAYNVQPVIEGYNLYLDGQKVNDELIANTTFVAQDAVSGTYCVKVVYNVGVSEASNSVEVQATASGIETLVKDDADVHVTYNLYGRRVRNISNEQLHIRDGRKVVYHTK
jgi:hypothetical protein